MYMSHSRQLHLSAGDVIQLVLRVSFLACFFAGKQDDGRDSEGCVGAAGCWACL